MAVVDAFDKLRERVIEAQPAIVDELQGGNGRECFRDASDADVIVKLHRRVGGDIACPKCAHQRPTTGNPDAYNKAGLSLRGHSGVDDINERLFICRWEALVGKSRAE